MRPLPRRIVTILAGCLVSIVGTLTWVRVPLGPHIAVEVETRHGACDYARRRIQGGREMQWVEVGIELRRRLFAVRHENRAKYQNVWTRLWAVGRFRQ